MTTTIGHITTLEEAGDAATRLRCAITSPTYHQTLLAVAIAATSIVLALSVDVRWRLARDTLWQCDEIPLLVRFTGLAGQVATQKQAEAFEPTRWTWMSGVRRSVHIPRSHVSLHTTTGFWVNHSLHLFGVTPLAGRIFPFAFALLAIPIVAWAAWLITRSATATAFAAMLMALSPQSVVYGVQTRGYAEAMALAPLLLVLLDYFRRRPNRYLRALSLTVVAIWMALTVYTSWLYWVLPVLLMATWHLPRSTIHPQDRPTARMGMVLITIAATTFMGIYTVDRWSLLTFASRQFGDPIGNWSQLSDWASLCLGELTIAPILVFPLALIGALALRRTPMRWWLWLIGAGIAAPALWTAFRGSPGYARNLGYLAGPVALLAAVGADRGIHWLSTRIRPVPAIATVVVLFGGVATFGLTTIETRARAMLLPDWSVATQSLEQKPMKTEQRWIAPCLAHHWQAKWYRDPFDAAAFAKIPEGGHIEIAMGATLDRRGSARVFQEKPRGAGSDEIELPDYLKRVTPTSSVARVEWRRWMGTRTGTQEAPTSAETSPVFALIHLDDPARPSQWKRFLQISSATDAGVITFKAVPNGAGEIRSLALPARSMPVIRKAAQSALGVGRESIHFFTLSPLDS